MAVTTRVGIPDRSGLGVRTLAGTSLALLGAVVGLIVVSGEGHMRLLEFPTPLAFGAVGAVVVSKQPRNTVGWLFVVLASSVAVVLAGQQFAAYASARSGTGAGWAAWIGTWPVELFLGMLAFALLLFPDGLVSRRWRPVAFAAAAAAGVQALAALVSDVNLSANFPGVKHPLAVVDRSSLRGIYQLAQVVGLVTLVGAVGSILVRLRHARPVLRQQLKWVAYGAFLAVAAILASLTLGVAPMIAFHLFVPLVAVGAGVAIVRHRLYDIDLLINRTLVYAALTGAIAVTYLAGAGLAGAVLQGIAKRGTPFILAAVIAGAFGPIRDTVQRGVDRLMYGHRHDPYAALSEVGRRLESTLALAEVLPELAQSIAQALRLPYVAIEVLHGDTLEPVAAHGSAASELLDVPLVYRGESIGRLLIARRSESEELSTADRRLLEDLARQAAVAVLAVRLTVDLQRSRERLVAAREEERRRLRRDLHDGLGSALAGIALQLDDLHARIEPDPAAARDFIAQLKSTVQDAVVDIRRLVYDLRPPALDELGLVSAIRQKAEQLSGASIAGAKAMSIMLDAPEQLNGLPAAVEVAAYRIAAEAVTNAQRHAGASRCVVRLTLRDALEIEVVDDGLGVPVDARPGVGLISMRERAQELGGGCTVERLSSGGTKVTARLPVKTP